MRYAFVAFRLLGVAAVVAAVIGQLSASLSYWTTEIEVHDLATSITNFFSFFTIQSNLIGGVALLIGAGLLLRSAATEPRWFGVLRACATAYLATTGIVYNTLLRQIELPQGLTVPWSNELLHVVVPIIMVVDWLFAPGRRRLGWGAIGAVVAYPIVWAVYTMVRGPLTFSDITQGYGWYPYPFLDPANAGYGSVALYVVLIAAIIAGAGAGVIAISRGRRRARR